MLLTLRDVVTLRPKMNPIDTTRARVRRNLHRLLAIAARLEHDFPDGELPSTLGDSRDVDLRTLYAAVDAVEKHQEEVWPQYDGTNIRPVYVVAYEAFLQIWAALRTRHGLGESPDSNPKLLKRVGAVLDDHDASVATLHEDKKAELHRWCSEEWITKGNGKRRGSGPKHSAEQIVSIAFRFGHGARSFEKLTTELSRRFSELAPKVDRDYLDVPDDAALEKYVAKLAKDLRHRLPLTMSLRARSSNAPIECEAPPGGQYDSWRYRAPFVLPMTISTSKSERYRIIADPFEWLYEFRIWAMADGSNIVDVVQLSEDEIRDTDPELMNDIERRILLSAGLKPDDLVDK